MGKITIPSKLLELLTDRGNVDTLTAYLNVKGLLPNSSDRAMFIQQVKKVSRITQNEIKDNEGNILMDTYYDSRISNEVYHKITNYSFSYRCLKGYMKITLSHDYVLGRTEKNIIDNIKKALIQHFKIDEKYLVNIHRHISLGRIDYKRDYRYRDLEEYHLIKQIISIAPKTIVRGYYSKDDKTNNKSAYIVKYKTPSNKSAEFFIYDKAKEQNSRIQKDETTFTDWEYFRRIIRFEVRIFNEKLNNRKYNKDIAKSISIYKEKKMARQLFNYYAEQAFFTEPIYRIDIAKELICKRVKRYDTQVKLCEVLAEINTNGFTKAREKYTKIVTVKKTGKKQKNYTQFNRYIEKIRTLGINPLTFNLSWIDEELNIQETTYKQIPNFTSEDNCVKEEALMDDIS